ncbi:MAG: response regulator [Chloroflexi bacterium]|nr:response regulator [Chloroflexota bacterium]
MDTAFYILHVDDNAFDRQLVRDALERENSLFTVTTAASRQEFEIQLLAGHYDLVVTDFDILGYQGLEVIDRVHEVFPDLPVIVLTGTGSEEIAVEAMKRGAADYVIKNPYHIRRLPMAIQSAIERRRLRDERVRAEQKLLRERNLLRTLIDNVPDVIYVTDLTGRFIASNAAHAAAAHTTPSQMIGRTSADVFRRILRATFTRMTRRWSPAIPRSSVLNGALPFLPWTAGGSL